MNKQLIMAFDCGTTSLKAVLVDLRGTVLAEAGAGYGLSHPESGWAEQSPEAMWHAIGEGARSVLAAGRTDPSSIAAVVFAATWKGVVPLDEEGTPLADAMIWLDSRATEQAARLNTAVGSFVGTGQEYWPRLMWLKEQRPDIWARAEHIVGLNSWFKWRATGHLVTDPSDDFIRSPVPTTNAYYARIVDEAGLAGDTAKFPPSELSTTAIGSLTAEAAEHLGLTERTRVFNGFSDLPAVSIGSGSGAFGDVHIYLGSSSWFARVARSHEPTGASATFAIDDDRRGDAYGLQSACLAYDWAVTQLYSAEKRELGADVNTLVNEEVAQTAPGADGLLATHWLTGEIPPLATKNAKGLFFNLTPLHDRRHMVRAVMESIAFSHRLGLERHRADGVGDLARIRLVGGGATSDVWMQIFADVLKVPIEVPPAPTLAGAMGAAYSAMVGLGEIDDYAAIDRVIPVDRLFEPRPEHAAVYDRLYSVYTKLHPALDDLFAELNGEY